MARIIPIADGEPRRGRLAAHLGHVGHDGWRTDNAGAAMAESERWSRVVGRA